MKKNEVIGCYNRGKHYVETCLEQIASLEQSDDKELHQALMGTYMVEVSYKAAENFVKVCGYVINGEDGAEKLKGKLYDLKEKVRQLYDSADKHNLITIKDICDSILREIGEVEEWANDNESDGGDMPPVTGINILPEWKYVKPEIQALFKYPVNFNNFLKGCYLPNGEVKDIRGIVRSYDTHRVQDTRTIAKGIPTLLYTFLRDNGIIKVPEDNQDLKLRTFQREMGKLQ